VTEELEETSEPPLKLTFLGVGKITDSSIPSEVNTVESMRQKIEWSTFSKQLVQSNEIFSFPAPDHLIPSVQTLHPGDYITIYQNNLYSTATFVLIMADVTEELTCDFQRYKAVMRRRDYDFRNIYKKWRSSDNIST